MSELYFPKPNYQKIDPVNINNLANLNKRYRLAVIVPYRDNPIQKRKEHLEYFIPFMSHYLNRLSNYYDFHIIVIEQSDDGRKFNRGKLLNVGFRIAQEHYCDYCIFHDVDLIPDDTLLGYYAFYPYKPLHIASVWEKYQYLDIFFGGVCAFNMNDFQALNGFPNTLWGWGCEDEELYYRMGEYKMEILQSNCGHFTEQEHVMSKTILGLVNKKRDEQLFELRRESIQDNGLATLKFTRLSQPEKLNFCTYKYCILL